MDDIIKISDEEKENWHLTIQEKLGDQYDHDIVEKKLRECINGWPRAPKLFEQRVERKFFHKTNIKKPEVILIDGEFSHPLFSQLTSDEVTFFQKRMNEYEKDFIFNLSSDKSLLIQLVFEEIVQARCLESRLDKKDLTKAIMSEDMLNNSMKRMMDLQKTLGITREKRREELEGQGGDIATLSMTLEQKMKSIEKQSKKDREEEEYFLNEKSKRPVINVLPPLESLGGDLERITEIAIEEMSPIDNTEIKQEPKKESIGLPTGVKL